MRQAGTLALGQAAARVPRSPKNLDRVRSDAKESHPDRSRKGRPNTSSVARLERCRGGPGRGPGRRRRRGVGQKEGLRLRGARCPRARTRLRSAARFGDAGADAAARRPGSVTIAVEELNLTNCKTYLVYAG